MKAENQLVVLSGILVLLATATIAATYNVQTVEAKASGTDNFGHNTVSSLATGGFYNNNNPANANGIGGPTSGLAHTSQPLGALASNAAQNP